MYSSYGIQGTLALRYILQSWSVTDPAAARAWLGSLPAEQRAKAIPDSGDVLAALPAADWLALTRGLPVDHSKAEVMAQQALEHTRDPVALAEWCASLADNSRKHLVHWLR